MASMALTLDDLFATPDHYLHSFEGDAAVFVPMDRAAYHRSIFLDARIAPAGAGAMRVPVAMLTQGPPRAAADTGWIFHIAHCGSTLLARALDDPQANLVLREPLALRQTAIALDDARLALVTAMIAKRYRAALPTLVKANVPVNFVLPRLAQRAPQARAILLHLGLRDYLLAILRSDNHRDWLRRVTTQLAPHLGDLTGADDARRAAALWLGQTRAFAAACVAMPGARVLDAERFFADPLPVLEAVAEHLRVAIDRDALARTVAGSLFATYSKNPGEAFDNDARVARRNEVERAIAPEIARAEAWLAGVTEDLPGLTAALDAAALIR